MTQDEIIEMAIEAGLAFDSEEYPEIWLTYMNVGKKEIQAFANLVAAKEQKKWQDQTAVEIHEAVLEEREACAKFFDDNDTNIFWGSDAARFIRARGET